MKIFFTRLILLLCFATCFVGRVWGQIPFSIYADGFDYPIGNRGYNDYGGAKPLLERLSSSEDYNNVLDMNNTNTSFVNPDRSSGTHNGSWYNLSDVGNFVTTADATLAGLHPAEDWNSKAPSGGGNDVGAEVKAVANGQIVRRASTVAGYMIFIKHILPTNDIYYSVYQHTTAATLTNGNANIHGLSSANFEKSVGDWVTRGEVIGRIITGAGHLHFEMRDGSKIIITSNAFTYPPSTSNSSFYRNDRGNGYYTNGANVSWDSYTSLSNLLNNITTTQIQTAITNMKADGIIDPSDFIDSLRPRQLNQGLPTYLGHPSNPFARDFFIMNTDLPLGQNGQSGAFTINNIKKIQIRKGVDIVKNIPLSRVSVAQLPQVSAGQVFVSGRHYFKLTLQSSDITGLPDNGDDCQISFYYEDTNGKSVFFTGICYFFNPSPATTYNKEEIEDSWLSDIKNITSWSLMKGSPSVGKFNIEANMNRERAVTVLVRAAIKLGILDLNTSTTHGTYSDMHLVPSGVEVDFKPYIQTWYNLVYPSTTPSTPPSFNPKTDVTQANVCHFARVLLELTTPMSVNKTAPLLTFNYTGPNASTINTSMEIVYNINYIKENQFQYNTNLSLPMPQNLWAFWNAEGQTSMSAPKSIDGNTVVKSGEFANFAARLYEYKHFLRFNSFPTQRLADNGNNSGGNPVVNSNISDFTIIGDKYDNSSSPSGSSPNGNPNAIVGEYSVASGGNITLQYPASNTTVFYWGMDTEGGTLVSADPMYRAVTYTAPIVTQPTTVWLYSYRATNMGKIREVWCKIDITLPDPIPTGNFKTVLLAGLNLNPTNNELEYVFEAVPCGPGDPPINVAAKKAEIIRIFKQAIVVPEYKHWISLNINNCQTGMCVGDATYDPPFHNTDIIDRFYQADVNMKFDMFTSPICGIGLNTGTTHDWAAIVQQSPYFNQVQAANYHNLYPSWLVRACILSNNLNYSSQGPTKILINDAIMSLDREVMYTSLNFYPGNGLSVQAMNSFTALCQGTYKNQLLQRLNNGAATTLPQINATGPEYQQIREIYRITAAAHWYRNLAVNNKPFQNLINTGNLTGIGRTTAFNKPYWDGQAWQYLSTEQFTHYLGGTWNMSVWGGCLLQNPALVNSGQFSVNQNTIDNLCFVNKNKVVIGSDTYFYGGILDYPSIELSGVISAIGAGKAVKLQNIPVQVSVFNRGKKPSGSFIVRLYEQNMNNANILIGQQTIANVDTASFQSVTFTWVPQTIGNSQLKATVDETNQVVEKIETDNISYDSVYVYSNIPTLTFFEPLNGASVANHDLVCTVSATDNIDTYITNANITWKLDNVTIPNVGDSIIIDTLSLGQHTIRCTATNSIGISVFQEVTIFAFPQDIPLISITSPVTGTTLSSGINTLLNAQASDLNDGIISQNIIWKNAIGDTLGYGANLTHIFGVGTQIITASVTNTAGNTAYSNITLNVLNGVPTIAINTPANNASFLQNQSINLTATANDYPDGNISNNIHWTSTLSGNLGTGNNLTLNLNPGLHKIKALITDSHGHNNQDSINVQIDFTPPTVAIISPTANSNFWYNNNVTLSGTATDIQDGTLTGTHLQWYSSLQGFLGTGNSLTLNTLWYGTHTISLKATDNDGANTTVSVQNIVINLGMPTATITSPLNNSSHFYGNIITFTGTGTDPQDGALSGASLVWTSSLQGNIGTGNTFTLTNLVAGTHTIRLTVTDSDNFTHYVERTIIVIPPHNPQISIVTPANNTTTINGPVVVLQALAQDFEEGNLPNHRVNWVSSLNGNLGTGLQKTVTNLSIGTHIITATATDTLGATASAAINITVLQNLPNATILSPSSNLIYAQGDTIIFSGTATDYEDGTLSGSALTWYSVQQGLLGSGNSLNVSTLNTGSHEIQLIATDNNNGKDTATLFLIIQGLNNYIQTKFYPNQDSVMKNFGILTQDTTVYVSIPKDAIVSNAQGLVQGLAYSIGGGVLDASFNPGTGATGGVGGYYSTSGGIYSMVIQPDGKIIIGGDFTFYNGIARNSIARINSDASLDTTFNPGSGADSRIYTVLLQPDGKIIIGGDFNSYNGIARYNIARINVDGSLDGNFNPPPYPGGYSCIFTSTLQPDGKIITGGNGGMQRFNTNGSLDVAYYTNQPIYTSFLQPDGKILIGGNFTNKIARLTSNGSLDNTFNPGSGANNIVRTILLQPDGKIVIGGPFNNYNGVVKNRIARINSNGSLDVSFTVPGNGASGIASPEIYTAILQPDGKIIIGGHFTTYTNISRNRIARLNTNSLLDASFNPGSGASDDIHTAILQPDGKIIIGGNFTSYNGVARNYIARILNSIKSPYNPYIDVANNGTHEWSYTGLYNTNQVTSNFATEINNYLATATPLTNGNVLVPIKIHADSGGIVILKNLNIQYQYADVVKPTISVTVTPNPVNINTNIQIDPQVSDNTGIDTVFVLIDGVYYPLGYQVIPTQFSPLSVGKHTVKVVTVDISGLVTDTTIYVTAYDYIDEVALTNFSISSTSLYPNDTLHLQTTAYNWSAASVSNIPISFYDVANIIHTQLVSLNTGDSAIIQFDYAVNANTDSISVKIDPLNVLSEGDEFNNIAIQTIQVFDIIPPTLSNMSVVPNPAFVGQTVQIQTNASDNHGIATVSATLFGQTVNMPFNAGTGKYEGTITASTAGTFTTVCTVTDTDGLSTQQTESVTVLNAGIDLTLSPLSIIATPSTANAGQSVSIAYTLQNNGNLTVSNAQVSIHIDNQPYTTQTVSLAGNSNTTLSFTWSAICGNHTLSIVADSANVIAESNESNNNATTTLQLCLATPVVIDTVIASPQPDIQGNPILFQVGVSDILQVDSLCMNIASQQICLTWNSTSNYFEANFTPSIAGQLPYTLTLTDNNGFVYAYTDSVLVLPLAPNLAFAGVAIPPFIVQNQSFTITATLSNIGGTNVQNASVYFLADGNVTDSTLVSINANATASISTSYSLPYGNHTLAIQLDPQNAITESVETDNNYQSSVSVIDNQAPVFQFIQVSQPLYAGGSLSLETTIWDELPIMQANVVFNGNTYPLQIDTLTGNYTLSLNNLPQGSFTLNFSATDSSGLVGQTDYPITINNNQPDASVSAIDITYLNSLVSTTDSIQVVIHNNGGSNIVSLPVRIKMDGNIIASSTVPLAMGQTDTVYTTYTNTLGTHTVSVELDALNTIPESNETNNIANRTVYVWDDTPPSMPILSVNPNTWTTGGSFNLNWTASTDNYGIAAYEYKIENGAWQSVGLSLSTNISYTQNGVSNVYLRAKDLAGNVSENSIAQMFIDLVAPTNPLIAEWHCGDIWTTHDSPYYQWLNPGDEGSGIIHYDALVDGLVINIGDSLNYHPTLLSGQHIVQIRGVDNVGNIGSWSNSDTVYVDTEIPNAPTMVSPTHPNQNQWYQNDSIALIISQLPDISGIEGFHWAITHDSIYTVAPTNYWLTSDTLIIDVLPSMDTLPTRIPDGIWYIHIAAKDGVGHLSQTFSYRVKIDKTAPETHYIVQNTTPIDTIMQCSHTFNLVVEDYPMYTTYNTFYSLTGNNFVNNASVYLPNYGLNKVYFYSVDDAGNQETLDSVLIYLAGTDTLAAPSVSCGVFDIDLLNFTATPKDAYINLQWESAKEINAAKYELERKTENYDFGFISSAIANGFASHYQYPDFNVLPNTKYYYRLKLIDNDGLYKYSKTVEAMLGDTETIVDKIYPNPTSGLLNVEMWLNENADIHFTLVNALGQVVVSRFESMQVGNNLVKLDLNGLASGVYQLQVKQDGKFIGTYSVAKE